MIGVTRLRPSRAADVGLWGRGLIDNDADFRAI
jgi:hypothetical protein